MKQLLNTLYVMTQGAYVCLDHETVKVEVGGKVQMQVPSSRGYRHHGECDALPVFHGALCR